MILRPAILVCLVPAAVLSLHPAAAQQVDVRCHPSVWSAARTLTMPDGRPVYVDAPVPARFSGGLALLGAPTFVWSTPTVFADTGAGARSMIDPSRLAGVVQGPDGGIRLVQMPTGATRMLAQRAVSRGDGSLDVFWGESPDTSYDAFSRVPEVWQARFGAAGWSVPQRVLAFDEIGWNAGYPVTGTIGGETVVAVPVRQTKAPGDTVGIMYLRREHGAWHRTLIATASPPPMDIALAATSARELVLAFVGSSVRPPQAAEPNGVFVVRSHDAGATWSAPRAIAGFGIAGVNWLRLVETRNGDLHLIWSVDRTRAAGAHVRTIERASSPDGGASWQRGTANENDPFVEFFDAARFGDSVLLVGRSHDEHRLVVAAVAGDRPISWRPLPFDAAETLPRLTALGSDSLMLSWGSTRAGAYPLFPELPAPLLETATITTRCDSVP